MKPVRLKTHPCLSNLRAKILHRAKYDKYEKASRVERERKDDRTIEATMLFLE